MKDLLYNYLSSEMTERELKNAYEAGGGRKSNWGCGSCKKTAIIDLFNKSEFDNYKIQKLINKHKDYILKIPNLKSLKLQKYVIVVCVAKAYLSQQRIMLVTDTKKLSRWLIELETLWKI